jgi:RNA polymerase sigma-70 factor (ECF subfamily)
MEITLLKKNYSQTSDDELTDLSAQPDGFTELFHRYATRIYRYLLSRLGNSSDAEELTAQVFLDAYRSLTKYRRRGYFPAWLFTIASRRAADYHRHAHPTLELAEGMVVSNDPNPLDSMINNEAIQQLENLVQKQTSQDQEMLRLRFAADLSYAEIARVTGKSHAAVKMSMSRLLRRMRKSWENEHE